MTTPRDAEPFLSVGAIFLVFLLCSILPCATRTLSLAGSLSLALA
jgi:hypothetical protein